MLLWHAKTDYYNKENKKQTSNIMLQNVTERAQFVFPIGPRKTRPKQQYKNQKTGLLGCGVWRYLGGRKGEREKIWFLQTIPPNLFFGFVFFLHALIVL